MFAVRFSDPEFINSRLCRVEHMSVMGSEDLAVPLDVTSDGNVTWKIPVVHQTYCDVSILTYPFDDQVCDITVVSWEDGYGFQCSCLGLN